MTLQALARELQAVADDIRLASLRHPVEVDFNKAEFGTVSVWQPFSPDGDEELGDEVERVQRVLSGHGYRWRPGKPFRSTYSGEGIYMVTGPCDELARAIREDRSILQTLAQEIRRPGVFVMAPH